MPRIRTIKPSLFRHVALQEAEQATALPLRLVFMGLFICADREGRFRWQPKELKLDIAPYDDFNLEQALNVLAEKGFILKYRYGYDYYGCIPSWHQHQCINKREPVSQLPAPPPRQPKPVARESEWVEQAEPAILDKVALALAAQTQFNEKKSTLSVPSASVVAADKPVTLPESHGAMPGSDISPRQNTDTMDDVNMQNDDHTLSDLADTIDDRFCSRERPASSVPTDTFVGSDMNSEIVTKQRPSDTHHVANNTVATESTEVSQPLQGKPETDLSVAAPQAPLPHQSLKHNKANVSRALNNRKPQPANTTSNSPSLLTPNQSTRSVTQQAAALALNESRRLLGLTLAATAEPETQRKDKAATTDVVSSPADSAQLSKGDDVAAIFAYWAQTFKRPEAKLDQDRRRWIQRALKGGYSAEALCEAITGCAKTPFNQGDNPQGVHHTGLHIIFKNAEQIERFRRHAVQPPEPNMAQSITAQVKSANLEAAQLFVQQIRGEQYA